MKEQLTTYQRREKIRLLLVREKSTTTRYLMDYFGVTKKTILKDIMFLSSIIPIESRQGNGGGIFLKMEYDAPKVYLSEDEEELLLKLLDTLCVQEKKVLINIINKFSMPVDK